MPPYYINLNFALIIAKLQLLQVDHIFASKVQIRVILDVSLSELNFPLTFSWANTGTVACVWPWVRNITMAGRWEVFLLLPILFAWLGQCLIFHTDYQWSSRTRGLYPSWSWGWLGKVGIVWDVAQGWSNCVLWRRFWVWGSTLQREISRRAGRKGGEMHAYTSTPTHSHTHVSPAAPTPGPHLASVSEQRLLAWEVSHTGIFSLLLVKGCIGLHSVEAGGEPCRLQRGPRFVITTRRLHDCITVS